MQSIPMTLIGMAIICVLAASAGCRSSENRSMDQRASAAVAGSGAGAAQADETAASKNALHRQADIVEIQGTVVYKELEGGFYAIEGDDGRIYDPINLPESFKTNGLRVRARVRYKNDAVGIHMAGDIVEIVDIAAQ
jgi:hypothetical protein